MKVAGVCVVAAVVLASCSGSPEKQPTTKQARAASAVAEDALVGKWIHERPDGGAYYLTFFESGVVAFQHVGARLPISRAYGHWSVDGSTLRLAMIGHDPDSRPFPLPGAVTIAGARSEHVVLGGQAWHAVADPYGVEPGVRERRARDERSWAQLVERASAKRGEGSPRQYP